jgi:hypothetical protein
VKTPRLIWIAMLCLLNACGGGSSSSQSNMSGNWTVTAASSVFGVTGIATGKLTQSGNSVIGSLTLNGTPCATTAALTGTVNGTNLALQIDESGQTVTLTGTASAGFTSASGTYVAPAGGCTNGDSGTWTAAKG